MIVDKNIIGASPMISSATDMTCSVVKKGASEANVVMTASDKVMFIIRMNAWLLDETSVAPEQTTCATHVTSSASHVTSP